MAVPVRSVSDTPSAPEKSYLNTVFDKLFSAGNGLVSILSGLLAAFLILYSGYVLYDTAYIQGRAFSNSWELIDFRPQIIDDDSVPLSGAMAEISPNYRCWLTVFDTAIDYPVMQGENDLYYATHDVFGNSSLTGAIYLAADNEPDLSDPYNILYGHHMDNGAMFGGLDSFLDAGYFASHREGVLVSNSRVYDLKFFAAVETDAYESRVYKVGEMDEVMKYIEEFASIYYPDDAEGAEKIVGLSTCAAADTNGRLVVFATMTERELIHLTVSGSDEVFDGRPHSISATVNVDTDTVIEYSLDGGETWTTEPPSFTDAGEHTVTVRVSSPYSDPVIETVPLIIRPRPVTVTALPDSKVFGTNDPIFAAAAPDNAVEGYPVEFTVSRPGAGTDETVGSYSGAIVPSGERFQGNYDVSFVPANFTITRAPAPTLIVTGYSGVYDGRPHGVTVAGDLPDGSTVEFSTDGGKTWTTTPPTITNVGEQTVQVRATNPNYETATYTTSLSVTPAPVTVRANNSGKTAGQNDPAGYAGATVTGVIDGFAINYTVSRPRAGQDEAAGTYPGALQVTGAEYQGNYRVSFEPGDFTIQPAPAPGPAPTLTLNVTGYTGEYDGQAHGVTVGGLPAGTTVEYSTDGGRTWSTTAPTITDVGSRSVQVRATNPNYTAATATATLTVTPRQVTVRAIDSGKAFGADDPAGYNGVNITGVIDGFDVSYTVSRPGRGRDENVGSYPDALTVTGPALQGNYRVSYVPGSFTIVPAAAPAVTVTGYTGVYDGNPHGVSVTGNIPAGSTIEYSTDGGRTWSTTPPTITDSGSMTVTVRVTNPNYRSFETTVLLSIAPKAVTVTANEARKTYGDNDPALSATVDGVIDGFAIVYTVTRDTPAGSEAIGRYVDAVVPHGERFQGNYVVTYIPADFLIVRPTAADTPTDTIVDIDVPLAQFTAPFQPTGGSYGERVWALVNLISLIVTIFLFLPLTYLKAKFRRGKMMKEYERELQAIREARAALLAADPEREAPVDTAIEKLRKAIRNFRRRFRFGLVLELIISVAALLLFLWSEDMRNPMVLIDRWTPLQIALLLLCWIVEIALVRSRVKTLDDALMEELDIERMK